MMEKVDIVTATMMEIAWHNQDAANPNIQMMDSLKIRKVKGHKAIILWLIRCN